MKESEYLLKLEELNSTLNLNPHDGSIHFKLGKIYREISDYTLSISELNKALELGFDNDEVHLEFGRVYQAQGEHSKVAKELEIALRKNSSNSYIHLELSRIYREKSDYDSALKELKQAQAFGLDNEEVHLELGRIYLEKGDFNLATGELITALAFNPSKGQIHLELGRLYQKKRNYDLAIQEIRQAQELGISREETHLCLGTIYREKKEYEQSVNEFQEILKVSPRKNETFFRNKIINEIEISQRKIVLSSKPRILGVTLTNKCNLRCSICDIWKDRWEIPNKIIQEVIDLYPYLEQIVWQGGEVFLVDYFQELFDRAVLHTNLNQSIITNGLLIDEGWAKKLAKRNINLTIGIDGVTKKTYEEIRRGGSFEDLLRCLSTINKYKREYNKDVSLADRMTTIMNFVVMKLNYRELEHVVDFAKEYEFDSLQLYTIEGVVDLNNIFLHNDREALEYIGKIKPQLLKKAKELGIHLDVSLPEVRSKEAPVFLEEKQRDEHYEPNCPNKKDDMTCYLPWQQMYMTPDRKLKAGCYCNYEIGNIYENSLEEIWNGKMMQLYRKKILDNDCKYLCYRVPKELDAHFELMRIYYKHKDYTSVEAGLNKLVEFIDLNPDNLDAHVLLGRIFFSIQKDDILAIEEFKKALKISPKSKEVHYELGLVYRRMSDYDSAIKEIKQALEFGFDKEEAHLELSSIYREKGDYDLAIEELNIVLGLNPSNSRMHLEFFRIYRTKKDYPLALQEATIALRHNSSDSQIHLELGRFYREMENYKFALAEFKQAIQLGLDNEEVQHELNRTYLEESKSGLFYKANRDYVLVMKELKEAINKGIDTGDIRITLSKIYREQGEYALAEKECLTAIRLNPQNGQNDAELTWLYEEQGEYNLAIGELQLALKKGFDEKYVHIGLNRINRKRQVVEKFNEFIEGDTSREDTMPGIIMEYIFQEGYKKCIKKLEEIIKDQPTSLCAHIELAWIYGWHKQYDLAIRELKKINEIRPYNKEILSELNRFFHCENGNDLPIQEFKKILQYIYNFNNQEINLTGEIISTLKSLFMEKAKETNDLIKDLPRINALYNWRYPTMTKVEGALLYIMTRLLKPEIIVEAGTWMGTSTSYLAKGCCDNQRGKVITVDKQEDVGYAIPDDLLPYINFHKKTDIKEVLSEICNKENKIDMFFHDSNNSYELLRWEIKEILPFFNKNGLIIVHDIFNLDDDPGKNVAHFFNAIKDKVKCYLFNTEKGIGVIKDSYRLELKDDKK